MKKFAFILLFNAVFGVLFCTTIITKYEETLNGEIKKGDSRKVYFVDERFPDYLWIINFEDISSVTENDKNITEELSSKKIKGYINYNSFRKVIHYDSKNNFEFLLAEEDKKNSGNNRFESIIKLGYEEGNIYFDSQKSVSMHGFSASFDITNEVTKKLYFGIGFSFQLPRKSDPDSVFEYNNISIYGISKVNLIQNIDKNKLFISFNLGYNKTNFGGLEFHKSGIYIGGGSEMHLGSMIIEFSYRDFSSSFKYKDNVTFITDMHYRVIAFSVGFKTF
jgi:hypothetical protein